MPGTYRVALSVNYSSELLFQDFNILEPAKIIEINGNNIITPNTSPVVVPVVEPVIEEPVVEEPIIEEEIPPEIYRERYDDDEEEDDD
jgi:hypothetical protein